MEAPQQNNLLQIRGGSKSYAQKLIFEGVTLSINEGEHIGVIGPNGAGKSTLFKAIVGEETLDDGEIIRSRNLKLGYLAQYDDSAPAESVAEYLSRKTTAPLWDLMSLGSGLGLEPELFERPVSSLSGGYRMRVKLLSLLGQEPNLMLLDEPTNYLDLETILLLENVLQSFKGSFLLISHDREFLKKVTDVTVEVETGDVTKFPGNVDDYFEQKKMIREQLERTAANLATRRAEIQKFIDRFKAKASKAKQAQARMKMLDKMETIEIKALPSIAKIRIPPPAIREKKKALSLESANLGYGSKIILKNVSFNMNTGDKVGVVGLNGAGKTTLLKTLSGELPLISGSRELGFNVQLGYYAQHVSEALQSHLSVYQELERGLSRGGIPQDVLDLAGSLLFSGSDVQKMISILSGGEKARVALGKILLGRFACLILDEPTNHLDFYTVEALTQSLSEFPGAVILVSHDRSFIRRVCTKIIEVNHGEAHLYPGHYDDYVWSLQKRNQERQSYEEIKSPQKIKSKPAPNPKEDKAKFTKELQLEIKRTEKELLDLEKKMGEMRNTLTEMTEKMSQSAQSAFELSKTYSSTQSSLEELEEKWILVSENHQSLKSKLEGLKS